MENIIYMNEKVSQSTASKDKIDTGDRKSISFSQFQVWLKCPHAWKLSYIDKMRKFENSIHTAFGTAIHEATQTFVEKLYTEGSRAADGVDMIKIFDDVFKNELSGRKMVSIKDADGNYILNENNEKTYKEIEEPVNVSQDEIDEFTKQGHLILSTVGSMEMRQKYFPPKKYELVGIETPINLPIMNNLAFIGYLDIVLRDVNTKKIKIIDLKTATRMWNKYQQNDVSKLWQLLFYKAFYSKQYGVPLKDINVEFVILKRTLLEGVSFPESRIQKVVPPSTKNFIDESMESLLKFIGECFNEDGTYNTDGKFYKNPHKGKTKYSNCKYCEYSCKAGGPCDRKEGTYLSNSNEQKD